MKRRFLIVAAALLMSAGVNAQEEISLDSPVLDGFNFSNLGLNGTASYVGRAGAIGALGGDFTAASYNPAGLGFFYSSRISFTPMLEYAPTQSNYMGYKTNAARTTFKVGSFELLLAVPTGSASESGWHSFQFGIGMNRLKSFNGRSYVRGGVVDNSLLDAWCDDANYNGLETFTSQQAYNAYLLDTLAGGYRFFNNFSGYENGQTQERHFTTRGGISEIPISFSGNYGDKLYVGATIGIPILSYKSTSIYRETAENAGYSYDYTEEYEVSGSGINFKFGAIYRPVEMLRIGLAIHTPTIYEIKDLYYTSIYNSENGIRSSSVESEGGYNFCTPMKLIASVAASFGNQSSSVAGSIDVDYEYSNYSGMTFTSSQMEYSTIEYDNWRNQMNLQIDNAFRGGHTLRAGAQLNVRHWALRGGLAYFSNPYKEFENAEFKNAEALSLACGFGYQTKYFFWDFAYAHTTSKDMDAFAVYDSEMIHYTNYRNVFTTTIGFKF